MYALEGSIAVTGSAVQWLRDQLGIISGASEIESLARQVKDNGGMYFVPAFSGLFAPYWRSDARGAIVGLSRFNTNAHLARATLESICYQSRDVAEAMEQDSGVKLEVLKVDGGVTANDLAHADAGGHPRRHRQPPGRGRDDGTRARPTPPAWRSASGPTPTSCGRTGTSPRPGSRSGTTSSAQTGYAGWKKAVERTLDWVDVG